MRQHARLFFIISVGVLLSGLLVWNAWPAPFPDRFNDAQEQWHNQQVNSYELHLTVTGQPHYQADYSLTVRNNQIVHAECIDTMSGECRDYIQQFMVPGLFTKAQAQYDAQQARPSINLDIRFDPTYGFPQRIESYDPRLFDGRSVILVDHFAVLQ